MSWPKLASLSTSVASGEISAEIRPTSPNWAVDLAPAAAPQLARRHGRPRQSVRGASRSVRSCSRFESHVPSDSAPISAKFGQSLTHHGQPRANLYPKSRLIWSTSRQNRPTSSPHLCQFAKLSPHRSKFCRSPATSGQLVKPGQLFVHVPPVSVEFGQHIARLCLIWPTCVKLEPVSPIRVPLLSMFWLGLQVTFCFVPTALMVLYWLGSGADSAPLWWDFMDPLFAQRACRIVPKLRRNMSASQRHNLESVSA